MGEGTDREGILGKTLSDCSTEVNLSGRGTAAMAYNKRICVMLESPVICGGTRNIIVGRKEMQYSVFHNSVNSLHFIIKIGLFSSLMVLEMSVICNLVRVYFNFPFPGEATRVNPYAKFFCFSVAVGSCDLI